MRKTATNSTVASGPEVLRFTAFLACYPDVAQPDTWARLEFPKLVGDKLCGMKRIEGTINGHPFRAALESGASGLRWLRVNKAMREGAGAKVGDTVHVAILGPEPDPVAPADLQAALTSSSEARSMWESLTLEIRRDWIRWIEAAKLPATRDRRVLRTIEQLAERKRRPCCVNFYEYMLSRICES